MKKSETRVVGKDEAISTIKLSKFSGVDSVKKINVPFNEIVEGEYEAYLYRYVDLPTGRMYYGVHKGSIFDLYQHSSESDDFNDLFLLPTSNLSFEILELGEFVHMKQREAEILVENDAKNNPLFFNKSNGIPLHSIVRSTSKIINLRNKIIAGYFTSKDYMDVNIVKNFIRFQSRGKEHLEHKKEIEERIIDAGRIAKNCSPIVLLENYDGVGKHRIIDGIHTLSACISAGCKGVPVAIIPKLVWNDFSYDDLFRLSVSMNPLNSNPKIPTDEETIFETLKSGHTGYIVKYKKKNIVRNQNDIEFLKGMGYTDKKVDRLLRKVDIWLSDVDIKLESGSDEVKVANWLNYNDGELKPMLEAKIADYKLQYHYVLGCSSISNIHRSIINLLFDAMEHQQNENRFDIVKKEKTRLLLLVHHSSKTNQLKWQKGGLYQARGIINTILDGKPNSEYFEVDIKEMTPTVEIVSLSDIQVKQ